MTTLKQVRWKIYTAAYDEVLKLGKNELQRIVGDYDILYDTINTTAKNKKLHGQFIDYLIDQCQYYTDRSLTIALKLSQIKLAKKLKKLGCQPAVEQNYISSIEVMKLVKKWNIKTPVFDSNAVKDIYNYCQGKDAIDRLKLLYEDFKHPFLISQEQLSQVDDEEVFIFCLDYCQPGTNLMDISCRAHNFKAINKLIEKGDKFNLYSLDLCCNAQNFSVVKKLQNSLPNPPQTYNLLASIFSSDSRCTNCNSGDYSHQPKIEYYYGELGPKLIEWLVNNPEVTDKFDIDSWATLAKLSSNTNNHAVITANKIMDLVTRVDANGIYEHFDETMEIIEKLAKSVDPKQVYNATIDYLVFEAGHYVEYNQISRKDLLDLMSSFKAIPNLSDYLDKISKATE